MPSAVFNVIMQCVRLWALTVFLVTAIHLLPLSALARGPVSLGLLPKVLITAFEPFAGRSINLSSEVAAHIPTALAGKVEVSVCILPVVYDEAAREAQRCIRAFTQTRGKPDLVISLGEGGGCRIRLETLARNLDHTPSLADNAGEVRADHPILAGAPDSLKIPYPALALYCEAHRDFPNRVRASNDAGAFVCNNTAFHLSRDLPRMNIPYGFIHVPSSADGCYAADANPQANAVIIAQMIDQTISRALQGPTQEIPVTTKCERDFQRDLGLSF